MSTDRISDLLGTIGLNGSNALNSATKTKAAKADTGEGAGQDFGATLRPRVRQLRSQVLVFARAHFQKCHYNSASCSGVAGFSIPKA